MKKHFYSSLLVLAFLGAFTTVYPKMSIAVNTFQAKGVNEHEAELIASRLRSRLVRTDEFQLLERTEMETILKEQGFQQSGSCSEQSCVVEIGQVLGVKKMISGSVGKIGRMYTVAIRTIDVATGKIEFSAEENCRCPIEEVYTKSTQDLAQKLIFFYNNPTGSIMPDDSEPMRRSKIIRHIAIGTAAVGLAVGGILYEREVRSTNQATVNAGNMGQNEEQQRLYNANRKNRAIRNIMFIGSGLSLAGFSVSFFF